jgi:lipopolysaccharide/colanic/teichoic acid biosynthesis glycosyltransferase
LNINGEANPPLSRKPILRFKRPFDLVVLTGSQLVLFPFFALLWLAIPLVIWLEDRGPIFFRQLRVGRDGNIFTQFKFRTMTVGAEQIGPLWTSAVDSRVTKAGRVLRRTALDEMPQLINIWRGDMSFVGPRALPIEMHRGYVEDEPDFERRLAVRPGLTGLAAINLPRHCPAALRLQEDLCYIDHASLWLDVKLVAWSVWLTLTGRWGSGSRRTVEPETRPF